MMKPLSSSLYEECAMRILDTIPLIMRTIGDIMHQRHAAELSFSQFRAMMLIKEHPGASLSRIAELLGASLSAASKLIDSLVERGYLSRQVLPEDRRRMALTLTDGGEAKLQALKQESLSILSEKLVGLSDDECRDIIRVMGRLAAAMAGPTQSLSH